MPQAIPKPESSKPSAKPGGPGFFAMLWPMVRPHTPWIILALALNALHGAAISFQVLMPKYLIDDAILKPGLTPQERWRVTIKLIAIYLVVSLVGRMLVWHLGYRAFTRVRERVLFGLRATFFRHVNHLCLRFHIKHNSGELFSYLFGTPLQQVQAFLQDMTLSAPGAVVTVVTTLLWVGSWDRVLTSILLLLVVLNVALMRYAKRRARMLFEEYQQVESSVSGYVADLLRGSRDVKLYAMEDKVARDFEERAWEIGQKSYRRDVRMHLEWMKQEALGYVCFSLLCAASLWRYLHDQATMPEGERITIGQIQGYLAAFMALQGPLAGLFQLSAKKGGAMAGLRRIDDVLRTASTTPDPIGYEASVPNRGEIRFFGVSFAYDRERPVLKQVYLVIPYGQRVALVGPSGAGKSTITQLLLRLYDPDEGAILIGGLNIRHCAGPDLRRRFGVVPQDPFIFRATLRENLCVAQPGASGEAIQRACEMANAWEFIRALPKGLDTVVGEGGSTLSGGQRQRLAIARALLTNPDFFIFDEATSALDTVSEKLIQTAMENAIQDRTAFVIAHRLATVKNCQRILVVQDGRIAQDGQYDELAHSPGLFQDLVRGQTLRS